MENKDLQNFDLIVNCSKAILTLYKELYILELNGKKSSKIYKNKLELLEWIEIEELKLYDELDLTSSKLIKFVEFLNVDIFGKTSIDRVMIGNYIDIHKLRFYNNLRKYAFKNNLLINEEYIKIQDLDEFDYKILKRNMELNMAFEDDFNNLFLKNLQMKLSKRNKIEDRKYLLEAKYMLAYMENKLEFIQYNPLQDFSIFYLLSKMYCIDNPIDIASKLKYEKLLEKIEKMLAISDDEYDSGVNLENILLECYINSYLQMTNFEEAYCISMDINEIIQELQIKNNKKSIKALNKIINKALKY